MLSNAVLFQFPSIIGQHCLSWEGTWREVTGLAKNASFEIREQAGHSLKSALKVNSVLHCKIRVFTSSEVFLVVISEVNLKERGII